MSQLPCRAVNLLEMKLLCNRCYYLGDLNAACNKQLPSGQNKVNSININYGIKNGSQLYSYEARNIAPVKHEWS